MERETATHLAPSLAPEHDWATASRLVHPALRPVGTLGISGHVVAVPTRGGPGRPLVRTGPLELPIVYILPGHGFDVFVGMEHLLSWNVGPDEIHAAAMANLAAWSAQAPWVEEVDGNRHLVWSDAGEGMDAVRILLPEVRRQLALDLSGPGRVLIGLPERDLLIAASLVPGDDEFAELFASYVAEHARDSDEPVDDRVFELVAGEMREFATLATA